MPAQEYGEHETLLISKDCCVEMREEEAYSTCWVDSAILPATDSICYPKSSSPNWRYEEGILSSVLALQARHCIDFSIKQSSLCKREGSLEEASCPCMASIFAVHPYSEFIARNVKSCRGVTLLLCNGIGRRHDKKDPWQSCFHWVQLRQILHKSNMQTSTASEEQSQTW